MKIKYKLLIITITLILVPMAISTAVVSVVVQRQCSQRSCVSAWNYRAVLEPKVEKITVEDQLGRMIGGIRQPAHKSSLGFGRYRPEVNVACEINGFFRHGDRKVNWVYYTGKAASLRMTL